MSVEKGSPASAVHCDRCASEWDPAKAPFCPVCLAIRWLDNEGLIQPKHDPREQQGTSDHYRSVLTPQFLIELATFVRYAARHGQWYFDTYYEKYVHFTPEPLGRVPGVGIPAGSTSASEALDSMLVADAIDAPHIFAADRSRVEAQIAVGEYQPLGACETEGCSNVERPSERHCVRHRRSASAGETQVPELQEPAESR